MTGEHISAIQSPTASPHQDTQQGLQGAWRLARVQQVPDAGQNLRAGTTCKTLVRAGQ